MKPLIGITANLIEHEAWAPLQHGQNDTCINAVLRTGGLPVILPLTDDHAALEELNDHLDGILFAGGEDLADPPSLRDRTEIKLATWALRDARPVLGLCRGMQLLSHVRGGSLHVDIAAAFPEAQDHAASRKAHDIAHVSGSIKLASGTKISRYLGCTELGINEYHHQAIDRIGAGLKAVGWSQDGIIEAIENPDEAYCVGVQCHPESLFVEGTESRWRQLFSSFISAAVHARDTASLAS